MNRYPHEVVIENEAKVSDGSGGYSTDWVAFKNVNAHVQPISGRTFFEAQQIESKINYKVFMEYDKEISNTMRVNYQDKHLTIDTIIDQGGLNDIMVLMCSGS
jgi:SPP1 family predicted phage head-tail adaptor